MPKRAIIIGAGPAGLTAAYELLKRTDIKPILIEKDTQVGGISKTVDYKGNKMDFGPHRFFSKSDRVMNWWTNIMPLHTPKGKDLTISYQNKSRTINTGDFLTTEEETDLPPAKSMLVIERLTRIYFLRKFFSYPIQLSIATLGQLGIWTTIKIVFSYLYARLFPRKPQNSLEDFMINKFGNVLYRIFFKDYTEKVWGIDCKDISADWGAQRIKGVSLSKAVIHAAKSLTKKKKADINQKGTETSLIEQFLYPAQGAGAMWEEVARQVEEMGGKIVKHYEVKHILTDGDTITGIQALNSQTSQLESLEGDYFISTMPVQELIAGLKGEVPTEVKEVAAGLLYRDFVYAGVLVKKMVGETLKDSWVYIQESNVKVARMQIYNNWGPYMMADPNNTVWLGLEYFCTKGDDIWNMTDEAVEKLAVKELIEMDLVKAEDVLDTKVNRMEKTYPAYFGTYDRFPVIQQYLDKFANLFLVGRNGMHKYNNADHSMLTAMVAVDNIIEGVLSKDNLWSINTEQEYHEVKKEEKETVPVTEPATREALQPGTWNLQPASTFKAFLLEKRNKRLLWISVILIALQWTLFKYLYPFASYIHGDSFGYILAAAQNADINTHMIGYSRFLRLFSVFSSSDTVLTTLQYLMAQISGLLFLFTLFYFHPVQKGTRIVLWFFMVINPMFLYMANLVSSDCLFMSLSLTWFALMLWLVHRPSNRIIFWHTVVLCLAFTIRYNALVYPAIAALAFFLAKISWTKKLIGIAASAILCGLFVFYTGNKYQQLTGTWQYAPFSGWQAANNAMYTYRYVDSADRKPVPEKFKKLDNMIRAYFDSTRDTEKYPVESIKASTAYMWSPSLPLLKYRGVALPKKDSNAIELKKWALMGPLYKEYGTYILKQYPLEYAQHFLWPNFIKYYAPPAEFLEFYNDGRDSVTSLAKIWFQYKSTKVRARIKDPRAYPLEIYPILTGTMNVLLFCCLICFVILYGFRQNNTMPKTMVLVVTIWLLNAVFTIASSPAAIRLQAFPLLLETCFGLVLVDWLWKLAKNAELAESLLQPKSNLSTENTKALA